MKKSGQILVTSTARYIASILCEHLLNAGYQVTAVDNPMYGQHSFFHLCATPRFEFMYGNVRAEGLMRHLVKDADAHVLIPLAASVGAPACDRDPWPARSVNLEAVRLLKRLRSPRQLVIFPTVNSGYGAKSGDVYCTEETPLEPISLYGQTKVQAEADLLETPNVISLQAGHDARHVPPHTPGPAGETLCVRGGHGWLHRDLREGLQAQLHPHPGHGRLLHPLPGT